MSKRILVILIAVLGLTVLITGLAGQSKKHTEESSEESAPVVTAVIIVPAEIPSRISFDVPAGFSETRSEAFDKYYTREDASVIITGEELVIRGIMLDEYTAQIKAQYEKSADEYQLISENEASLPSGLKCRVLEFTYAIVGTDVHQSMQCITAVLLKDNCTYIITCKSKKENFSYYRSTFLQMIDSIKIADADSTETVPALQNGQTVPADTTVN